MNWKNLKEFLCPHCGNPMEKNEKEIACTKCTFHIEHARFYSIMQNRGGDHESIVKMKWQNLHQDCCPMCASVLVKNDRGLKCTSENCTFLITDSKMEEIMKDRNHPANRFQRQTNGNGYSKYKSNKL